MSYCSGNPQLTVFAAFCMDHVEISTMCLAVHPCRFSGQDWQRWVMPVEHVSVDLCAAEEFVSAPGTRLDTGMGTCTRPYWN